MNFFLILLSSTAEKLICCQYLGILAVILITYGLILFLKRGNKEFNPKLSLKERRELEKMVEKEAKEEKEEKDKKEAKTIEIQVKEK